MDQVASILDEIRQFYVQHPPSGFPTSAIPVAIILLVVGIALSVLGARFARFGLTSAFVVAGGVLGDRFAEAFQYHRVICVPIGALLVGLIGFQTFRLWVGAAIAVLLSSLVVSGFGANRVVPHLVDYSKDSPLKIDVPSPLGETEYSIPTRDQQIDYVNPDPRTWFSNFWAFLTERDPNVARNTQALGIVTALAGLCLGLMAVRPALIISTSVIGTVMVTMGAATLMTPSVVESSAAVQNNPRLIGLGVAAFLATSLLLQTLLMRKSTVGGSVPAKS